MTKELYQFIADQTNDTIIERRICPRTNEEFPIFQSEKTMIEKLSPVVRGKKFEIPLPVISPRARQIRRLLWRNENNYYSTTSSLTGEKIISIIPPELWHTVYKYKERMSDQLDPMTYTITPDTNQTFAQSFQKLEKNFPRTWTVTLDNQNSDYSTGTAYCKDCYFINSSENCENCSYGKLIQESKNCFDCAYIYSSERLYQCFNLDQSNRCIYTYNSSSCSNTQFCDDCVSCHYCFLCTWLRNKSYCIRNIQYTKEEYEKIIAQYTYDHPTIQNHIQEFNTLRQSMIVSAMNQKNAENCYGDYLLNSKNCLFSYDVNDSEDCMYLNVWVNCKDLLDCNNMYLNPQRSYDTLGTIGTYNVHRCLYVFNSSDVYYSQLCYDCDHLFGCIGLRNKSYCIFNTQYTKEERESKVQELFAWMQSTGEFGQYRSTQYVLHPYNDSLAGEYYPIQAVVDSKGNKTIISPNGQWTVYCHSDDFITTAELDLGWSERIAILRRTKHKDIQVPPNTETIAGEQLNDPITAVDDSILAKIVICAQSGRPFRLTKQELQFYRTMNLPLPQLHPDIRYYKRLELRQPRDLHIRKSDADGSTIASIYPENANRKVYDNKSYQQIMFG